ncbi:kinase-like domain-containing protein [Staphylotrichum tortipilum]|uniref:Kinase-like domain-containing protein n=1 Tax=Staphylotrichum tortipilum TaxID=2831512 RepID=A0AAN6RNY9_9PEZI|nr:kinase-like domain-containing protein [Staphylotrichum longicolle]
MPLYICLATRPPVWLDLRDSTVIYEVGDRQVSRVGTHYILKRTRNTGPSIEAATHRFIAANTDVPVPRIHAEWLSRDRQYHFLLQQRMPGEALRDCWSRLSHAARISIADQVADHMYTLSQFRSSKMQTVRPNPAPLINNRFVPTQVPYERHLTDRHPHSTSSIFHVEFGPALKAAGVDPSLIRLARRTMPPCRDQLALTHCDLFTGNIMVDAARARVTAIIDWETAGYWPLWFQHARATHGCDEEDCEWKWMLSRAHRRDIPHADHGRVWWDAVRALLREPESTEGRDWLRLVRMYMKGEVGVEALRAYRELGVEGLAWGLAGLGLA